MGSSANTALNIIILVYFTPALLAALYTGYKHGFDRRAGWLNLILLAIFRLVGSILSIVATYSPSSGVLTASLTFSNLGTVSLVGALVGIALRANRHLDSKAMPSRVLMLSNIIILVAVILGIVAASTSGANYADSNLAKGSIVLLVVEYVIGVLTCAQTFLSKQMVPQGERRLLYACILSLAPILVRLVYSLILVFGSHTGVFSIASTSDSTIIVKAIMEVLMEFIAVALFLWAGCTAERSPERQAQRLRTHSPKDEELSVHEAAPPSYTTTQKPVTAGTYGS